jgi:hypothetical protein
LQSLREAENAGYPIEASPITRKTISGFIPLGNHQSHVEAADWSISQLITGGKSLGNKDFWFSLIWILVEQSKIPYLKELIPFFREQMIWRLKNRSTTASLCVLSGFIQTRLRLDAAIYFSLVSSKFKIRPEPQYDILRLHLFHSSELIQILNLLDIQVPEDISRQIIRIKVMMQILTQSKKNGKFELLSIGNALVQKCYKINRNNVSNKLLENQRYRYIYIPLDGPASNDQIVEALSFLPASTKQLPLHEVYELIQLADPQKSAVDINIPLDWEAPPLPKVQYHWKHYEGKLKEFDIVQISPLTFRPYSVLSDGNTWQQSFGKIIPATNELVFS